MLAGMSVAQGEGVRRAKQAAMLLTMAIGLGWSGPAADAQASRPELATAMMSTLDAPEAPVVAANTTSFDDGEWRYIPARR